MPVLFHRFSTTSTLRPSAPGAARQVLPVRLPYPRSRLIGYLALGMLCGLILVKSEIASWFRIQEMLRFQGFHMFGFFFSAVATAAAALRLIERYQVKTLDGEPIVVPPKQWGHGYRYPLGGLIFGCGWALLSACPGPIYALMGSGVSVMVVALLSALAGTWVYGYLRPRLPH